MNETHPARDAEFLSRLHDGELSPAERAHFESHRAHCAECRRAAAEFEQALSLYRSSRPMPPSPDLAGRILRKLQTSTPPRRRFGISFGIDLRWAGAFAAAVVAAIIGSTIVGRQEAREGAGLARSSAPIPIVVQSRPSAISEPSSPSPAQPSEAPRTPAGSPRQDAPLSGVLTGGGGSGGPRAARKELRAKVAEEKDASGKLSASEEQRQEVGNLDALQKRANEKEKKDEKPESRTFAAQGAASAPAPASPPPAGAAAAPGMASALRAQPSAALEVAQAGRARLRVEALDGMPGPALATAAPEVSSVLRGRSWIVIVEPTGQVRSVREQKVQDRRRDAAASDEAKAEAPPPELLSLRFSAGDRERRLLVRVE